jgi:hypothetical protein
MLVSDMNKTSLLTPKGKYIITKSASKLTEKIRTPKTGRNPNGSTILFEDMHNSFVNAVQQTS